MSDENKEIAEVQEPSARVIDEKDMKTFWFGDTAIRGMIIDDVPWFVAKGVTDGLGYSNSRDAIAKHVEDEDKNTVAIRDGIVGNPNKTVINESGMYSLIFGSKLEGARQFKHWVTSEVLPQIRKTGRYTAPGAERRSDFLEFAEGMVVILDKCKVLSDEGKVCAVSCDINALAEMFYGSHGRRGRKREREDDFVLSRRRLEEVSAFCDRFCDVTGNRLDSCKLTDLYGVYKRAAKERVMKRFEFKNALSELYDSVSFSAQTPAGENVLSVRGLSLKHKYWELF